MATDALPAVLALDRGPSEAPTLAPARGPSLLRRIYDAIVEAQSRRAERELARHLRALGIRHPDDI